MSILHSNIRSVKKDTKRSSNTLLCLVYLIVTDIIIAFSLIGLLNIVFYFNFSILNFILEVIMRNKLVSIYDKLCYF